MNVRMYTDGGARNNPGPGGIGIVLCDEHDVELECHKEYIGEATNNIAEYRALITGLQHAARFQPQELSCFLDSELVVKQLNGQYKVKNEHIAKLHYEVHRHLVRFPKVTFTHLPREHEKMQQADRLVNEALDEACA